MSCVLSPHPNLFLSPAYCSTQNKAGVAFQGRKSLKFKEKLKKTIKEKTTNSGPLKLEEQWDPLFQLLFKISHLANWYKNTVSCFLITFVSFAFFSFVGTKLNYVVFCSLPLPTCSCKIYQKKKGACWRCREERTLTPNYANKIPWPPLQNQSNTCYLPTLLSDECHIIYAVMSWKPELVLLQQCFLNCLHSTKHFMEAETLSWECQIILRCFFIYFF